MGGRNVTVLTIIHRRKYGFACKSGFSCSKGAKRYPVDNVIGFPNTYPLDSDLSSG